MKSPIPKLLLCALMLGGCAQHDARPAFRSALSIGDRGISIPLPPPSVLEEPNVDVDIDGEVIGKGEVEAGLVAHVLELEGDAEASVELPAGATAFRIESLPLDLTDNCLEAWLADAEGAESDHVTYHAIVEDDETILVTPGC
jgi:hypothetical protein